MPDLNLTAGKRAVFAQFLCDKDLIADPLTEFLDMRDDADQAMIAGETFHVLATTPEAFEGLDIVLFAGTDAEMRRIGAFCILTQCIALPIHAWVAVVNMLCAGLGDAKGALALSTARQGSCMIPVLFPLAWIFGAGGVASVQAVADVLSLAIAVPIVIHTLRRVREAKALQERMQA